MRCKFIERRRLFSKNMCDVNVNVNKAQSIMERTNEQTNERKTNHLYVMSCHIQDGSMESNIIYNPSRAKLQNKRLYNAIKEMVT